MNNRTPDIKVAQAELEHDIREKFLQFVAECRRRIRDKELRADIDRELLDVAGLVEAMSRGPAAASGNEQQTAK